MDEDANSQPLSVLHLPASGQAEVSALCHGAPRRANRGLPRLRSPFALQIRCLVPREAAAQPIRPAFPTERAGRDSAGDGRV